MTARDRELLSRRAIVARAVAIVDEDGVEALSLRSLARDLGVSAPALYDHILSKDDLLRLVAAEGYAELAARWDLIDDGDVLTWLRASSHVYVDFALDRPGVFQVMFRFRPAMVEGPGEIEDDAATALFERALAMITRAVAEGLLTAAPAAELALASWAATHGVAVVLSMSPELGKERWLVDLVVDGLLAGWNQEVS